MEFTINFQNSLFLRQFLAWIFYALLLIFIFSKIHLTFLVKKYNCKDIYTENKKKISNKINEKYKKSAKKILLCFLVFIIICIGIMFFIFGTNIIIFIFTGFGIGLSISNSPIISFIKTFMKFSLNILPYILFSILYLLPIIFYAFIYSVLIKKIYVYSTIKKLIKSSELNF